MSYKYNESMKVEVGRVHFAKERLQDIVAGYDLDRCEDLSKMTGDEISGIPEDQFAKIVEDEVVNNSRWSIHHECVFELNGHYYSTAYSVGATEMQDEAPYEFDSEWIAVTEVVPKEVTVTQYVPK